MTKRTTIEIDPDLLDRARKALGETTARRTVEAALRRVAESSEADRARRTASQRRYLEQLDTRVDLAVLASQEMWR
jgi:Arc/MetJ family transcription regulator